MKWILIGLAAARFLALIWEYIPGRVNMRWRGGDDHPGRGRA